PAGKLERFIGKESRHNTLDSLFASIGYGKTTAAQVAERILPDKITPPKETSTLAKLFKRAPRRSHGGVVVQGIDDVLVRFAKCCTPLPGEPIIGFITRGRGITVHHAQCPHAIDSDPERRIDVEWDEGGRTPSRPITLRILTGDRPGILATISQTFTDKGVNISQANCKVTSADRAMNTFEILVKDSEQLRDVIASIKGLKGVISIERA
ncbi:bifunctional (p)ppGpp synthetase/guanosine-3',5'-bis(diphosphate) 3'-pyrophosphohydrolase, partial [Myxococcota bacterium]|nr:bifunctional (p)ppGpp synthetase/guanosine-3',5'-bis(diphosphate) 3'-pyrophosphohydrolase [Myxococcota bacterium]